MKYWTKGKRLAAVLLALAMLLSIVPSGSIPVHSEQGQTQTVDYGQYIGYFAEILGQSLQVSADPEVAASEELSTAEFDRTLMLQIVDYMLTDDHKLWYKVTAAPGYALPAELAACPWIFQNRVDTYEYADALRLKKPAFSQVAASVVSDNGVTASSTVVDLVSLKANKLNQDLTNSQLGANLVEYVLYDMELETANGLYTGYATLTIPIPEGWDHSKLVGFVMDGGDVLAVIPGDVTEFGTFCFTVPTCTYVVIAQLANVADVESFTITLDKIQETQTLTLPDVQIGQPGRYTTENGAVAYEIRHTSSEVDGKTQVSTCITFTGLLPARDTAIEIDGYAFMISVHAGSARVEKLLTGTQTLQLHPLYDLGITGPYLITYAIADGTNAIDCTDGTVTLLDEFTGVGTATVVATVALDEKTPVATVTYTVTLSSIEADAVKTIQVTQKETVTIEGFTGNIHTDGLLQADVAAVAQENGKLTITGVAESGETYFLADTGNQKVLFVICAQPKDENRQSRNYLWFAVASRPGTVVYYAVNGGMLHALPMDSDKEQILLIDKAPEQSFQLTFFAAPAAGYITAAGSTEKIYCLSNGTAWPSDGSAQDQYGMEKTVLHDLFSRAVALGCDSVTSVTDVQDNALTFIVEKLPELEMGITHYKPVGGQWQAYVEGMPLQVGDRVRYQFSATIEGQYTSYDLTFTAPHLTKNGDVLNDSGNWLIHSLQIGEDVFGDHFDVGDAETLIPVTKEDEEIADTTVMSGSTDHLNLIFRNVRASLSFAIEYTLNKDDVRNYAMGRLENRATMDVSYTSQVASGSVQSEAVEVAQVQSIVTWVDSFGKILQVAYASLGDTFDYPDEEPPLTYSFDGWYLAEQKLEGDYYTYNAVDGGSVTILAKYVPAQYTVILDLGDGIPVTTMTYSYGDVLNLSLPKRPGYVFLGWKVTAQDDQAQNWPKEISCTDAYTMTDVYGNVTLTAQWSYTTLTIQVAGCHPVDAGQTFLYTISDGEGWQMEVFVTVQEDGMGSITIEGLDAGKDYVITQQLAWSWRYEVQGVSVDNEVIKNVTENAVTITLTENEQNTVTFLQKRVKDQWLDSNAQN